MNIATRIAIGLCSTCLLLWGAALATAILGHQHSAALLRITGSCLGITGAFIFIALAIKEMRDP